MDPTTSFIIVVSAVLILGVVLTIFIYVSDYFSERSHLKHKHA